MTPPKIRTGAERSMNPSGLPMQVPPLRNGGAGGISRASGGAGVLKSPASPSPMASTPLWRWLSLALLLAATPAGAADMGAGRTLFTAYCAGCHGQNGEGVLPGAPNFRMEVGRLMRPDSVLVESIRNGRNAMPGFQGVLTDRQLLDVVAFLRTLR